MVIILKLEISEELEKRIKTLKIVIDSTLGESLENDKDYIELILVFGIDSILENLLPKDEKLLKKLILAMFKEDPEFISNFVAKIMDVGKEERSMLTEKMKSYL